MTTPDELRAAVLKHLSEAGKKGGKRSLETLSPEQRRARAIKAGKESGKVQTAKAEVRRVFRALKEDIEPVAWREFARTVIRGMRPEDYGKFTAFHRRISDIAQTLLDADAVRSGADDRRKT